MPAASKASSRTRPAGPTKGRPCLSSWSPGCSPTNMTSASREPSPNTVCVPVFQRSHAWHPAAASRNASRSRGSGTGAPDSNSVIRSRGDGGVDRVVALEHALEACDLEHLAHRALTVAHDPQLAGAAAGQLEPGDQGPEARRVQEADSLQVDDELGRAVAQERDELSADARRRRDIDFTAHGQHLPTALPIDFELEHCHGHVLDLRANAYPTGNGPKHLGNPLPDVRRVLLV